MAKTANPSSEVASLQRHRKKFQGRQNLAPALTRYLSAQIDETVIPILEARGFRRVGVCLGDSEHTVSGGELRLERREADTIDSVTFNFEKYKAPRVQIHLDRRQALPPNDFVHSGNLVATGSQYIYFWGKPWWLPAMVWSRSGVDRTIKRIGRYLEQATTFLETGTRGPNISRLVVTTRLKGGGS
jgi:hypothetical protein